MASDTKAFPCWHSLANSLPYVMVLLLMIHEIFYLILELFIVLVVFTSILSLQLVKCRCLNQIALLYHHLLEFCHI